jgi:uncharacterized protein
MLRAVLDTNIFASAFSSPGGPTFRIWQAVLDRRFRLLISPALINELATVLRRRFQTPEVEVQRLLRVVTKHAHIIQPRITLSVTTDPDDNRILECAVEGKADLIVSHDRHLLSLKEYKSIPIVTGANFRRTLGIT